MIILSVNKIKHPLHDMCVNEAEDIRRNIHSYIDKEQPTAADPEALKVHSKHLHFLGFATAWADFCSQRDNLNTMLMNERKEMLSQDRNKRSKIAEYHRQCSWKCFLYLSNELWEKSHPQIFAKYVDQRCGQQSSIEKIE